jgi:hypothetical protein
MSQYRLVRISLATFLALFLLAGKSFPKDTEDIKKVKPVSRATETASQESKYFKGIEFLSGFGLAKLRSPQGSYHVIPLFVDFDFDLKPLLPKKYTPFTGLFQFVLEPFIADVYDPNNNVEVGSNFLFKIGLLPETAKFQPYLKGGVGFLYMSQHTIEQGSQFNFDQYAGLGLHYFFRKNLAFTIEYRFRHISNADIERPNKGINTNFTICGVTYRY